MNFLIFSLITVVLTQDSTDTDSTEYCPQGGEIYALGVNDDENIQNCLNAHNQYRQMILDDEVPGQPQGINIPMLSYDEDLAAAARVVSLSCKMEHNIKEDSRFKVGQNLFISRGTEKDLTQDWERAVKSWFKENEMFDYPNLSKPTLHYSQLIWSNTTLVGCDFIAFYDEESKFPYARLYSCNYGERGNIEGEIPYEKY